jgi:opacity protein-like surface antigen
LVDLLNTFNILLTFQTTKAYKMIRKHTKQRVAVACLLAVMTTTVFAESKPYFGGQLGYGHTQNDAMQLGSSGLAGRLFAGYQFNSYFSTELGWTKFHNATTSVEYDWFSTHNYTVKTNALDLVGKASYPVTSNIDLYGKLGVAYVMQNTDANFNAWGIGHHMSWNESAFLPTYGVGGSYHFTPKLAMDVSYNRIEKVGNTSIGSSDFVGAGLTYSFN